MVNRNETIPRRHRSIKVSHVLIILLLVCIGVFALFRLRLKSKLRARIDAIRAAGYPVTCAELDKWYKIPPNVENAAYTITDILSYYKPWDKDKSESLPIVGRAKLPARTEPLDEETKALIARYVADNNEALELFHKAAGIEYCRYPIDLSAGLTAQLHHVGEIRNYVRLLKLEAILHAENGNSKLAVRSAISSFGIAHSLAREPVIVSQLLRSGCQNLATSTIEYCINRIELTDVQLVQLIECVQNAERISDMSCAFIGERCMGLSFFKAPELLDPDIVNSVPYRPILELYKIVGLADSDTIIYLDLMDEYIKSAQLPPFERLNAAKAIEAKRKSTSQAHILLHIMVPAFSTITTIDTRNIAQLYTARVGLAVERYQLAAGKLPDALVDLVPDYLDTVPRDPFDGNELRYKKLKSGFVVYSIGEDLIDDGGKEKPTGKKKKGESWDMTFIIER